MIAYLPQEPVEVINHERLIGRYLIKVGKLGFLLTVAEVYHKQWTMPYQAAAIAIAYWKLSDWK